MYNAPPHTSKPSATWMRKVRIRTSERGRELFNKWDQVIRVGAY